MPISTTPRPDICSCGHPPTPQKPGAGGTGYGISNNGSETWCYDCCAERERKRMKETGKATLYLTGLEHVAIDPTRPRTRSNSRTNAHNAKVTDWPGHLKFPVHEFRRTYQRAFGHEITVDYAWFLGPDQAIWIAVCRGDMDLCRCKRTKRKTFA